MQIGPRSCKESIGRPAQAAGPSNQQRRTVVVRYLCWPFDSTTRWKRRRATQHSYVARERAVVRHVEWELRLREVLFLKYVAFNPEPNAFSESRRSVPLWQRTKCRPTACVVCVWIEKHVDYGLQLTRTRVWWLFIQSLRRLEVVEHNLIVCHLQATSSTFLVASPVFLCCNNYNLVVNKWPAFCGKRSARPCGSSQTKRSLTRKVFTAVRSYFFNGFSSSTIR